MPNNVPISPDVRFIDYTSIEVAIPSRSAWGSNYTYLNLLLKQSTSSSWVTISTQQQEGQNPVVVNYPQISSGLSYSVKWVSYEGDESLTTNFTTKAGSVGQTTSRSTTITTTIPQTPGPVTFDNPRATSVVCIHKDPVITSNNSTTSLLYRLWNEDNDKPWIIYKVGVVQNENILVNNPLLEPDTNYEFVFRSSNDITDILGPVARFRSNTINEDGVSTPQAPTIEAVGQTRLKITFPSLISLADYYRIKISDSINGPWRELRNFDLQGSKDTDANYESFIERAGLAEIIVDGLGVNSTYYFRVVGITSSNGGQYPGDIKSGTTFPYLPGKPDKVIVAKLFDTVNKLTLPDFPPAGPTAGPTDYLILERGTGTSPDSITWTNRWPKLAGQEIFLDSALTLDTLYFYRAIAVNAFGESNGDPVVIDTFTEVPNKPGPIHFKEILGSKITITRDFELPLKTAYINLYKAETVTGPWDSTTLIKSFVPKNVDEIIEELSTSHKYWFAFKALNSFGETLGDEASATTDFSDDTSYFDRPVIPTLVSKTSNSVTLQLPDLPVGADSLSIWYSEDVNGILTHLGGLDARYAPKSIVTINQVGNPLINLQPDKEYYFFTAAYSGTRNRLSDRLDVKTIRLTPLSVPTPVLALVPDDNKNINVTFVTDELPLPTDITHLYLYLSKDDSVTFEKKDEDLVTKKTTVIIGLDADTKYTVKLRGENDGGFTDSNLASITTLKDKPDAPGAVLFDDVLATRLKVLRTFTLPARADKVTLYKTAVDGSNKTLIYEFLNESVTYINVYDLVANSTSYFQFSATNNGGETFGPIAGVNTAETEIKLPPKKPLPPIILDDTIPFYLGKVFIYHILGVQSPIWSNSLSYPVEGMELWVRENNSSEYKITEFSQSEEAITFNASRCKIYSFKVRAYNTQNSIVQYSPYSDEATIDLNSINCTVKITKPSNGDVVFFKTYIEFTVTDSAGHSSEEVFIRGQPVTT